jgi:hypothetical protein
MLVRDKHSSLLDPFVSHANNEAVNTHPGLTHKYDTKLKRPERDKTLAREN